MASKKMRYAGANPAERRTHMDMEREMLEEGTAGEIVTPETETDEQDTAAEAEGEERDEIADRPTGKVQQSHEERARNSAARRQGEKTGYDRAMKDINARIAGAGLIDPITNTPIGTLEEFENYGKRYRQQRQEARAKAENKTVAQVEEEDAAMELLRQKRREDDEKAKKSREERARAEWMRQDAQEFAEAYPEVNPGTLEADPKFRRFCGDRLYNVPLVTLYEDYMEVVGEAAKTAQAKRDDKQSRGTGAGGGSGNKVLTAKQREELENWNRANPNMKMTEKEFREWNAR